MAESKKRSVFLVYQSGSGNRVFRFLKTIAYTYNIDYQQLSRRQRANPKGFSFNGLLIEQLEIE